MDCMHENCVLDSERGDLICSDCGEVVDRPFDQTSYKMNPQDDEIRAGRQFVALGERLNIVDGLGSYMGYQHSRYLRDNSGAPLNATKQKLFNRLKNHYDLRSRIANRETRYRTLAEIGRIDNILHLSHDIKNRVIYLYQKFTKVATKEEHRNNQLNLIGVCLYLVTKEAKYNCHLTLNEIVDAFKTLSHRVSVKSIMNTASKLKIKCGIAFENHRSFKAEDYLPKIVTQVAQASAVTNYLTLFKRDAFQYQQLLLATAQTILTRVSLADRGARNPYIFAVATIYAADQQIASQMNGNPLLTQSLLAEITKTTTYSIRDHWRYMIKIGLIGKSTNQPAS